MKKRGKMFIISFTIILSGSILFYISFLAPYNLQSKLNASRLGLRNTDSFKEVPELYEYFKGYSVSKVEYLGSNTYEAFTDKGNFIIMADYSDYGFWRYKIFRYDRELEHFTNPM